MSTKKEITTYNNLTRALSENYVGLHVRYEDEIYESLVLREALEGGSKTSKRTGRGKPEAAIFLSSALAKPIALVECKSPDNGGIQKAQLEAQQYVRHCANSNVFIPLAIGFDNNSLTVDFFIKAPDGSGTFQECRLPNGQSFAERYSQLGKWPSEQELLLSSRSSDGRIRKHVSVLEEEFTRDFILQLNETMQVCSVPVLDRVVLFTAFLVACRSTVFKTLLYDDELTISHAGRQTVAGFEELIGKDTDDDVKEGLQGFVSFITPKLISQVKGEEANGAIAIHRMITQDIRAVCAKHSFKPKELVEALNASMFNVVDVYEAFQAYAPENDLGQYFTPRHIVRAMIRLVEAFRGGSRGPNAGRLVDTDIVYDPACGVGGFLVGALERVAESTVGDHQLQTKRAFGARLMGCEPASEIIQVARINLWMHGDGTSGIYKDSSLERHHLPSKTVSEPGDHGIDKKTPDSHPIHKAIATLSAKTGGNAQPSVVLMNPPFPPKNKKKTYQAFEFVEHALAQLQEGGWLCAVVPATSVVVEDKVHKSFRKRVLGHAQLVSVIGLPADLFLPGASVITYLVLMKKQSNGHQTNQPVLFARCTDDGYSMDKSSQRRIAPKSKEQRAAKRWTDDGDFGSNLADLLSYTKFEVIDGRNWVELHIDGGVDIPRHAISANLSREDIESGCEWSPERHVSDKIDHAEILKHANRINAEAKAYDLIRYMTSSSTLKPAFSLINATDVESFLSRIPVGSRIEDLLVEVKSSPLAAAMAGEHGSLPFISTTEYGNGVVGYVDGADKKHVVPGNTISVAKNGRPMTARIQSLPYVKTSDVISLKPRIKLQSHNEMIILAALIENQAWRYSYGRKSGWYRMGPQVIT